MIKVALIEIRRYFSEMANCLILESDIVLNELGQDA